MSSRLAPLYTPFTLNGLTLPNRFVMAPMTRSKSPNQVPGDDVAAYYRRRTEGGVGLIITEGTSPDHAAAANDAAVPRFHGADALAGWAKVVKEVKAAGGFIMPQLWHVGLMRRLGQGRNPEVPPVGPSGLFRPGKRVNDPMTDAEVADVIAAFAKGAADAQRLGFDGVEIHGAHGYIIDQFFWEGTNERADIYGGDMLKRTRFAADIVRAARAAVGPGFPIILRWSQWKQQDYTAKLAPTPAALEAFLAPLTEAGVDAYHCSTRRFWEPEFDGSDMNVAGWVKKLTGKPTITVGSLGLDRIFDGGREPVKATEAHFETLIAMFERGDFDLVAVGRALLSNPDWVNKVRAGELAALRPYDPAELAVLF
ncbi:MAG: NADH:flavin oxidoreductase [Alphaproteobacteria bacterium]|nr:NADH:flavin oxidoreductase [Alphaproteobacteria bacterium]